VGSHGRRGKVEIRTMRGGPKFIATADATSAAIGEAWRVARAASTATAGQENKLLSMLKEAGWDGL